jgi:hypothetical protein
MDNLLKNVSRDTIIKATAIYLLISAIFGLCGGVALVGLGGLAGFAGAGGDAFINEALEQGGEGLTAQQQQELRDAQQALRESGATLAGVGILAIIGGILLIVLAPVEGVVAYGLFQRKGWARMGTVIVAVIALVANLVTFSGFWSIIWIVVSGFVAYLYYSDSELKTILAA